MIMHKAFHDHTGSRADKHFKSTVFQGDQLMIGLNCLEPGQSQHVHAHADADKAYVVMEGRGLFTVGDETFEAVPGEIVWAAKGVPHGVENKSGELLTVLVAIAPPPK
jgi:quercetin dioxygenase-like cupin family protein